MWRTAEENDAGQSGYMIYSCDGALYSNAGSWIQHQPLIALQEVGNAIT